ncbi:hypothetical protein [Paracraurococcus lichenis]|uniref:Uncharacterized protein n=1 Tax=Paracraurococcus lichenis TaxID=3064888 RepID=A0ABT9E857_9PROT|nr:hypothetical protein [Paracraurococcus sp. LOR1-02]MDO9712387.1 hypothetical protein [Paracraurococcus sp. LOR1-02]
MRQKGSDAVAHIERLNAEIARLRGDLANAERVNQSQQGTIAALHCMERERQSAEALAASVAKLRFVFPAGTA